MLPVVINTVDISHATHFIYLFYTQRSDSVQTGKTRSAYQTQARPDVWQPLQPKQVCYVNVFILRIAITLISDEEILNYASILAVA